MDPYYLRLRRRRRLQRAGAVCAFFALLSMPALYLLRGEIRAVAAATYGYAIGEIRTAWLDDMPASASTATRPPAFEAPAQPASATPSPTAVPPVAIAQAPPAAPRPQAGRQRTAKLGQATFRIPADYVETDADLPSKRSPQVLLRALLPDLRPRAGGRGACAPGRWNCPDFVTVKIRTAGPAIESDITKRYKTAPAQLALMPGVHGLQQVPPHKARPAGRQFIAQPAGRWVWITCRNLGRPGSPRPTPGVCQLAFDTVDGLNVKVRFRQDRLRDWAAIRSKAAELVASVRG